MADQDLYNMLGVDRDATQDEIRAAYRALARKLHPDVNKAPDAHARFTEVQEAYDVLSDENKRRLYDRTGRVGAGNHAGVPGGRGGSPGAGFDFEFDDFGSVFDSFFGNREARDIPRKPTPARRGADTRQTITVGLEDIEAGATVRTTTPSGERVDVKIPAGCAGDTQLRLRGRGDPPPMRGGTPGDLLLTVRIRPHAVFTRGRPHEPDGKSADLSTVLPVTIAEATFGATLDVPTLAGSVRLTVPPGTPSGRRLRLRGRGLPTASGKAGDLYALIRIVPPDPGPLDDADREAMQRMCDLSPPPRDDPPGSDA